MPNPLEYRSESGPHRAIETVADTGSSSDKNASTSTAGSPVTELHPVRAVNSHGAMASVL